MCPIQLTRVELANAARNDPQIPGPLFILKIFLFILFAWKNCIQPDTATLYRIACTPTRFVEQEFNVERWIWLMAKQMHEQALNVLVTFPNIE